MSGAASRPLRGLRRRVYRGGAGTSWGWSYESPRPGAYLVRLEGQHKLATMTWLIVGSTAWRGGVLLPPAGREPRAFYRFLLERNGRMYGVHFASTRSATST
jgi:hypothetical protein